MRKKYYVNVGSTEISQVTYGDNADFIIYATETEVLRLRSLMDQMHNADIRSFFRSHVPIMSYHNDQSNDDHDSRLTDAFQLIYQLGDDKTKEHIEDMGVLRDKPL